MLHLAPTLPIGMLNAPTLVCVIVPLVFATVMLDTLERVASVPCAQTTALATVLATLLLKPLNVDL